MMKVIVDTTKKREKLQRLDYWSCNEHPPQIEPILGSSLFHYDIKAFSVFGV